LALQSTAESELNQSACSVDVRALCAEFQRAIAALASDNVRALETSTAVQEHLVKQLQESFRGQPSGQPPSTRIPSSDLKVLVDLTRVYSSLLQRALRTARLRWSLCQTYKQNFPSAPEPRAATGWSCEV